MISDAPHLIKNIRNRLFNKKGLRESADSNYIRWSHYEEVHKNDLERDSIAPSRVCPKITHRHLAPDSFSKMNVILPRFLIILWLKELNTTVAMQKLSR